MMSDQKGVVLLSGGLDSATTAAIARARGFRLSALTFEYGQKHAIEVVSARGVAASLGIGDHRVISIPAEIFSSALTDPGIPVPRGRVGEHGATIPATYVPGRNILFLSYAIAYAESIGARHIFIGANAVDYSGYPDCRPEFFDVFTRMANAGTRAGVSGDGFVIETPIIGMKKSEIIRTGTELGVDFSLTRSCYDPGESGAACGECDSCLIRKAGFREAGIEDPVPCRQR